MVPAACTESEQADFSWHNFRQHSWVTPIPEGSCSIIMEASLPWHDGSWPNFTAGRILVTLCLQAAVQLPLKVMVEHIHMAVHVSPSNMKPSAAGNATHLEQAIACNVQLLHANMPAAYSTLPSSGPDEAMVCQVAWIRTVHYGILQHFSMRFASSLVVLQNLILRSCTKRHSKPSGTQSNDVRQSWRAKWEGSTPCAP